MERKEENKEKERWMKKIIEGDGRKGGKKG